MTLIGKQLDSLSVDDLQALIDAGVSEGREIEFKAAVGGADKDKREFLADVSSFANAVGGDLLIGVGAKGGVAAELIGIPRTDADATILRLENVIRDGLDPRIPGLHSRAIAIDEGLAVVVIRVPRSFAAPHMVSFGGLSRFYSRNSAGKHQLDVGEIRIAFARSDAAVTRLQSFRADRLARIVAGETPVPLLSHPKTVLHVVPLTAADPSAQVDTAALVADPIHFRPLRAGGWDTRVNFDGALSFSMRDEGGADSYTQVFRSGAVEGVEALMLRYQQSGGGPHLVPSLLLEKTLIEGLRSYLSLQGQLAIEPPYAVGVSLLGVQGHVMALSRARQSRPIDRSDLIVSEVIVEDVSRPPDEILKPAIDSIWQAAGVRESENYDSDGVWHDR